MSEEIVDMFLLPFQTFKLQNVDVSPPQYYGILATPMIYIRLRLLHSVTLWICLQNSRKKTSIEDSTTISTSDSLG